MAVSSNCMTAHSSYKLFYDDVGDVDDIVPLAIRHVSYDATDTFQRTLHDLTFGRFN